MIRSRHTKEGIKHVTVSTSKYICISASLFACNMQDFTEHKFVLQRLRNTATCSEQMREAPISGEEEERRTLEPAGEPDGDKHTLRTYLEHT